MVRSRRSFSPTLRLPCEFHTSAVGVAIRGFGASVDVRARWAVIGRFATSSSPPSGLRSGMWSRTRAGAGWAPQILTVRCLRVEAGTDADTW